MMNTKKIIKFILGAFVLLGALNIYADDKLNKIELIDVQVKAIERYIQEKASGYKQDVRFIDDIATEAEHIFRLGSSRLERHYKDGRLIKAIGTFQGDRRDLVSEYYYHEGTLIYVEKKHIEYSSPKWSDDYDSEKKTITTDSYYFSNRELICWLDNNKKAVGSEDEKFIKSSATIFKDAIMYQKLLPKGK